MGTELVPQLEQGDLLWSPHLPHMGHTRPHSPICPTWGTPDPTAPSQALLLPSLVQGELLIPAGCSPGTDRAATKAGPSLQWGHLLRAAPPAPMDPAGQGGILQHYQHIPVPATTPWHWHSLSHPDPGKAETTEMHWGRWHWCHPAGLAEPWAVPQHLGHALQRQPCTQQVSVRVAQGRCCCSEAPAWMCHLKQSLGRVSTHSCHLLSWQPCPLGTQWGHRAGHGPASPPEPPFHGQHGHPQLVHKAAPAWPQPAAAARGCLHGHASLCPCCPCPKPGLGEHQHLPPSDPSRGYYRRRRPLCPPSARLVGAVLGTHCPSTPRAGRQHIPSSQAWRQAGMSLGAHTARAGRGFGVQEHPQAQDMAGASPPRLEQLCSHGLL